MKAPVTEVIDILYERVIAGQKVDSPAQLDETRINDLEENDAAAVFAMSAELSKLDEKDLESLLHDPETLKKYNVIYPKAQSLLFKLAGQSQDEETLNQAVQSFEAMFELDIGIVLSDYKLPEVQQKVAGRAMSQLVDILYQSIQSGDTDVGESVELLSTLINSYQAEFLDEKNMTMLTQFVEVYMDIANAYYNQFKNTEEYNDDVYDTITGISHPAGYIVGKYEEKLKTAQREKNTFIMIQAAKDQYAPNAHLSNQFYKAIQLIAAGYGKETPSIEPAIIAIMKEVGQHPDTDPYECFTHLMEIMEQRNREAMIYVEFMPIRVDTRIHPVSFNEIAQFANAHEGVSLLDAVYLHAKAENIPYAKRADSSTHERMEAILAELKQSFPNTPLKTVIENIIDDAVRDFPEKHRQRQEAERAERMAGHADFGPRQGWTSSNARRNEPDNPKKREILDACKILKIDLQKTNKDDVTRVIKEAFNAAAKETHPDKTKTGSEEAFRAVTKAYNFLKEEIKEVQKMTPDSLQAGSQNKM